MAARGRHDCSCTTTKLRLLTLLKELQKSGSICLEAITYCTLHTILCAHVICITILSVIGENLFRPSHVPIFPVSFFVEGYGFFKLKDYVTA